MKNLATALLICFSLAYAQGQESLSQKVVFSSGIHIGEYKSFNMDIQYILDGKWSLRLGRSGSFRKALSQPEDYEISSLKVFSIFFPFSGTSEYDPRDRFSNYHLSAGRIFGLNEKGNLRLHLHSGIGIATIREPTNWRKTGDILVGLTDNYDFDIETRREWSYLLNPRIEYWNSDAAAFFFSLNLETSRSRTTTGAGAGVILHLWRKS